MDPISVLADLADIGAAVRVSVATGILSPGDAYKMLDDAIAMLVGPAVSSLQ